MRSLLTLILLVLAALQTGCASNMGTGKFERLAPNEVLEVRELKHSLDPRWIRMPNAEYNHQRFIWESAPTALIEVYTTWALQAENLYKRRWNDMLPREQAEYLLARHSHIVELEGGVMTDRSIEVQPWGGRAGYKVTAKYTQANGLDMEMVAYGTSFDRFFYVMSFKADRVESFNKLLPQFEKAAKVAKVAPEVK